MTLDDIDALIADTSDRAGLEPPPLTPDELPGSAQTVSFRDDVTRRNQKNKRQADRYRGEVGNYLEKIRRGRSVRAVDPNQPALSEQAELLRQTQTVDRANLFESRRMR
jgi:hypothetical protein